MAVLVKAGEQSEMYAREAGGGASSRQARADALDCRTYSDCTRYSQADNAIFAGLPPQTATPKTYL